VRWGWLLLLLHVAACESRYGAYFTIKGDIEFDQVELYFGTPMAPGSTAFATPTFGLVLGQVFDRTYDASDDVTLATRKQTTYYVPGTDKNQALGAYVIVVALSGGKPVGISEFFNFTVPSDAVHEYALTLEPWNPAEAERWGDKPGCVAWRRPRGGNDVAAVVHKDDLDCDTMSKFTDCNDLCPSGSPLCMAGQAVCDSPCAIGCSTTGICAPTTCLPPTACDDSCTTSTNLVDHLRCGSDVPEHTEIYVDTLDGQMCAQTLLFALPLDPDLPAQCLNPAILFTDVPPSDIAFAISEIAQNPQCMLAFDQSTNFNFTTTVHLLISIAQSDPSKPRRTAVIGIHPRPIAATDACEPTGYDVTLGGQVYSCF
jgi:hypothetical protein